MNAPESFQEAVCFAMLRFQGRAQLNIARARILVKIAEDMFKGDDKHHANDILRAAVVFLHSAVEDFLRNVGVERLPHADTAYFDNVPLLGMSGNHPQKFLLGRLCEYRGKTVTELLSDSVEAHLQRSTFNNTTDVCALLKSCTVDISSIEKFLPELQTMMERRHQIVHRADFKALVPMQTEKPELISSMDVARWIATATDFINTIAGSIVTEFLISRFQMSELPASVANAAFAEAASRMTVYINAALK